MHNPHEAIISIKPKYADAIMTGGKTVELRRRIPPIEIGSRLWIYATRPKAAIIGSVILSEIVSMTPDELWRHCGEKAAIDRTAYDAYFDGTEVALGLFLSDIRTIAPIDIEILRKSFDGFHPPQVMVKLNHERRFSLSNLVGAM
ncbi:MAG: ASCH domain-containing protein [Paracoccaceae bacterium]